MGKGKKYYIGIMLISVIVMSIMSFRLYEFAKESNKRLIFNEAQTLSRFIIAFRDTYQNEFISHHIPINEKTKNLLPALAIHNITDIFSEITKENAQIRTVSDKPRNPKNTANIFETELIDYFRKHPDKKYKIIDTEKDYYYAKPLVITNTCLKCHGRREDAPPTIRNRYSTAFGYKLGDIRGVSIIHLKKSAYNSYLDKKIRNIVLVSLALFLIFIVIIYNLLHKVEKFRKKYTQELETEVSKKTEEVYFQAYHDVLTGLPNRNLLYDRIEQRIKRSKRNQTSVVLLFINIDNFKEINETLGHHMGDEVLKDISEKLSKIIREEDTLARLGSDEFMIVAETRDKTSLVDRLSQQINKDLGEPFVIDNQQFNLGASIGISCYPKDAKKPSELISYAYIAMYKAKLQGKNTYKYFQPNMAKELMDKISMKKELRLAVDKQEFIPCFQPQIDLKTGKIVGAEVLARWKHPRLGIVMPDRFIPLAEETGIIIDIDRQIISKGLEQFKKWSSDNFNIKKLSFNISIRQLSNYSLIEFLEEKIETLQIDPKYIEVEITETEMIKSPKLSAKYLNKLHKMGISIAIDDFGTGYSSLSYLRHLPIDKLKIDKSFVLDISKDKDDEVIIKTIISMANSLNLGIVAEGVETEAQKEFLLQNNCYIAQGYLYSKPIPAKEFEDFALKFS